MKCTNISVHRKRWNSDAPTQAFTITMQGFLSRSSVQTWEGKQDGKVTQHYMKCPIVLGKNNAVICHIYFFF